MTNQLGTSIKDDVTRRVGRRVFGIALGIGVHGLFLFAVWELFWFLRDGLPDQSGGSFPQAAGSMAIDALLSLQFAVIHSLLLLPSTRTRITRHLPGAWYGLLFCAATSICLLVQFGFWRGSSIEIWRLEGWSGAATQLCFYLSWIVLLYSISLTGLGYQTGFTPWWHWLRDKPLPRRGFATHSLYRWLRHPVYFSFLGLIWFTPHMTLDHAVLTGTWTVYVVVGSCLKDRRMAFYIGEPYREYCRRVPGYPLMPFGPLAKRPAEVS